MSFWSKLPAFWGVRLSIFLAGLLSLGMLLSLRLLHVQLIQGAEFEILADNNRFYTLPVPAERGVLLDRYGEPLVWNTHRYFQVTNPDELHHQQSPISRSQALAMMASQSSQVVTTLERLYRYPESLSQVLGYVGSVSVEELATGRATSINERIGKLGLELSQNQQLRGIDGKEMYEINAVGQRQKIVSRVEPVSGTNVQTTIDPYLSQVAFQALAGKKGVVMIMNAQTGEVLSLVSSPSYNANYLTRVAEDPQGEQARQQQIQSMFSDERQLFFNRAINGIYPPGSVFKLITALAGLEGGKIDAATEVLDEGILKVGEYEYGNWYFRQYGRTEGIISLVRAIARSNDIYFYKAAEAAGPDSLAEMARLFGFGHITGLQLQPQAKGLVPDPAWKEQTLGERWYLGNTYHYGIGQGDLLVTPVQIGQMIQALGHQGTLCPPSIIATSPSRCLEIGVKQENLELVLQGMLDACSETGTAFPFFPYNRERRVEGNTAAADLANGAVACKTGTAEFGGADANGHRKTHGWFVALAEIDAQMVIAQTASSAAQVKPVNQEQSDSATNSASMALPPELSVVTGMPDRAKWVEHIQSQGFPRRLAFVAMIESDNQQPFVEGSREVAPVVKSIIDWMWGK